VATTVKLAGLNVTALRSTLLHAPMANSENREPIAAVPAAAGTTMLAETTSTTVALLEAYSKCVSAPVSLDDSVPVAKSLPRSNASTQGSL